MHGLTPQELHLWFVLQRGHHSVLYSRAINKNFKTCRFVIAAFGLSEGCCLESNVDHFIEPGRFKLFNEALLRFPSSPIEEFGKGVDAPPKEGTKPATKNLNPTWRHHHVRNQQSVGCLLYTSDAADE